MFVAQTLHPARREVLGEHLSPFGVLRRVDHHRDPPIGRVGIGRHDHAARPHLRMLQAFEDGGVVGEHPIAGFALGVAEHRTHPVLARIDVRETRQRRSGETRQLERVHRALSNPLLSRHIVNLSSANFASFVYQLISPLGTHAMSPGRDCGQTAHPRSERPSSFAVPWLLTEGYAERLDRINSRAAARRLQRFSRHSHDGDRRTHVTDVPTNSPTT